MTHESPRTPPRASLAFRVGVAGHKLDRLQQADLSQLSQLFANVLRAVEASVTAFALKDDSYTRDEPVLRAVSSLAEGTDLLFAEAAAKAGYGLICPVPFPIDVYKEDFENDGSLTALIEKAKSRSLELFVLDGRRENSSHAYRAAADIVLNQSDFLLVVWDGGKARGTGGTLETLQAAVRQRVPVLLIAASSPHGWRLLRTESDVPSVGETLELGEPKSIEELQRLVMNIVESELTPPTGGHEAPSGHADPNPITAEDFFNERRRRWRFGIFWRLFRDLVGSGHLRWPSIRIVPVDESLSDLWQPSGRATFDRVKAAIAPHYAWSDGLADLSADAYRSAYVVGFGLSTPAVFFALLPMAAGWEGHGTAAVVAAACELATVAAVLAIFFYGRRRRWHARWTDYRLLAELLRQLRFLVPLGGGRPLPYTSPHFKVYGNAAQSWMYWHVRAIARGTPVPNVHVGPDYLATCLRDLGQGLDEQIAFHQLNAVRSAALHHRLHTSVGIALGATLIAITVHVIAATAVARPPLFAERWLVLLTATLPAFGAALAGIANQGEFLRLAKRSEAMVSHLEQLRNEAHTLISQVGEQTSKRSVLKSAGDLAQRTARLMVDEAIDWRVVFIDRPPVVGA